MKQFEKKGTPVDVSGKKFERAWKEEKNVICGFRSKAKKSPFFFFPSSEGSREREIFFHTDSSDIPLHLS
jgi:hypothetical protein